MKKLSRTMILLFLLSTFILIFSACSNNEHNKITKDYAKLGNISKSEVSFKCYGEFEDTHVIMFGGLYAQALSSEVVDGVTFYHSELKTFAVYNNGNFYSLHEAYDNGLLTHDNLLTLRDKYNPQ